MSTSILGSTTPTAADSKGESDTATADQTINAQLIELSNLDDHDEQENRIINKPSERKKFRCITCLVKNKNVQEKCFFCDSIQDSMVNLVISPYDTSAPVIKIEESETA